MTQVEMLAGGPKPDFWREAIREASAVCGECGDSDADVVWVERVDEQAVLCEEDAERIPEPRRTREYIRIEDVPWGNPPVVKPEADSPEELVKAFTNSNGKVWVVKNAEGEIIDLVSPDNLKGNSLGEFSDRFAEEIREAVFETPGQEIQTAADIYIPGDDRFLVRASVIAWRIEEVSPDAAEIYLEEQG